MDDEWNQTRAIIKTFKDDPATTGGRDRLYNFIRTSEQPFASQISRREVARFLAEDPVHQQHRPLNARITTRPILIAGPAMVAQIDLIDFQKLAGKNGGVRYLLTYVDLFSKFVQVRAMLNKTQREMIAQMTDILDNMPEAWRPRTLQMDNGSEMSRGFEKAMADRGIKTIHSAAYQPRTQGAVERYNRELKSAIFQLMARHKTERYVDWLVDLVSNHNNSRHSTTGEAPLEIMESMPLAPALLQKIQEKMRQRVMHLPDEQPTFELGQQVRVALNTESAIRKQTFRKKIRNNWSATLFQIYSISNPSTAGTQPQYLLKNLDTNRKSRKRYWAYQLQDATQQEEEQKEEPEEEPEEVEEERKVSEPIPIPDRPRRERAPTSRVVSKYGERINF